MNTKVISRKGILGRSGQSIVLIVGIIALLILMRIGLFSYEINRIETCREQLRAVCESAALAAAATLASQDNLDSARAHDEAIQTALQMFRQNSLMGNSLQTATLAGTATDCPDSDHASIFIEFLDPNNNNTPVSTGNPAGKIVRITAAFGLQPACGSFLGIGTVPLRATSLGGVPDLDVVMCFDVSGSIDDQTPVTFVKRQWTGSAASGRNQYLIAQAWNGPANGKLYDLLGPPPTGTRVNGLPPQYLEIADQDQRKLYFSEEGAARGLRGTPNTGSPPGNCPPGNAPTGTAQTFTDLVVNIDGRTTFGGFTSSDGYAFPDVGTLTEAARGNLENTNVFTNSGASRSLPVSVAPRAGYQAKYLSLAAARLSPIGEAQQAAKEFFTIINTNTRAHFGFITFSDNAGTSPSASYNAPNVSSSYSAGGTGTFPIPNIPLDPAPANTNYDAIQAILPATTATTSTNIGDALGLAIEQLRNGRRGSKKAILLFTDGMPTAGGPYHSDPETNARRAAVVARDAGIPIYSIGLAQNPEIIPYEVANLTHTNSNPATGGVSGIAGSGGQFFLVTDVNDLRKTFENVARQLVQLVSI